MLINLYAFYFPVSRLLSTFTKYFLPKTLLLGMVKSKLRTIYGDFDVTLVSSGRSALYAFFIHIKNFKELRDKNEVLIPNYICNVVDKAVIHSGLVPIRYDTDEYFRPVVKDLRVKISTKTLAVVFAPIFGSFDEVFVQATGLVKSSSDAFIVYDNAQCVDCKPPPDTDAVILSFNDKDIWGVMGGALLIKRKRFNSKFEPEKLSLFEEFRYLLEFFKKMSKILKKESPSVISRLNRWHFEHSTCSRFPYTLNKKAISKISLTFVSLGLNELESYKNKRKENYDAFKNWCKRLKNIKIIETKNVSTSPFIPLLVVGNVQEVLSTFSNFRVQIKLPYAINGDPKSSVRSNVIAMPNNPKFDYGKIFRVS